jgi:hypothetical protein
VRNILHEVVESPNRALLTPLLEFELLNASTQLRLKGIDVTSKEHLLGRKVNNVAYVKDVTFRSVEEVLCA